MLLHRVCTTFRCHCHSAILQQIKNGLFTVAIATLRAGAIMTEETLNVLT